MYLMMGETGAPSKLHTVKSCLSLHGPLVQKLQVNKRMGTHIWEYTAFSLSEG